MQPTEMKILTIGMFAWGMGDTLDESLKNMVKAGGKRNNYIAYVAHPDSNVNGMGDISYPTGFPPKEFHRVGFAKKKAA